MSIRRIKRRHYRLVRRARIYDWGIDALMRIMCEAQRRLAAAVREAYQTSHEQGEAAMITGVDADGVDWVNIDIRRPPWYTQPGALQ